MGLKIFCLTYLQVRHLFYRTQKTKKKTKKKKQTKKQQTNKQTNKQTKKQKKQKTNNKKTIVTGKLDFVFQELDLQFSLDRKPIHRSVISG